MTFLWKYLQFIGEIQSGYNEWEKLFMEVLLELLSFPALVTC